MYAIRWFEADQSEHTVVGDPDSIRLVACLLEGAEIDFKVIDVCGGELPQHLTGWGGFAHWLDPGVPFSLRKTWSNGAKPQVEVEV